MVKNVLRPRDFLCKIDLKDAYFCIPIHPSHRKYLSFRWEGEILQYRSLPFGLAAGPRLFTKMLKPVVAILRRTGVRLVIYLDDMILLNQTPEGLVKDRDSALHVLHNLGWLINWKKSVLNPTQKLEFLGFELDSIKMTVSLPPAKIENILKKCHIMLNSPKTTFHELASLIGTLQSTMEAIIPAALYVRQLQMHQTKSLLKSQNYQSIIQLKSQCKEEIFWWTQQMTLWNGKQILSQNPDLIIETDASLKGWGYHCPTLMQKRGGAWNAQERQYHINVLELKAAEIALQSLLKEETKIHVHLKMDNTTAVAYVNKMGGTKSPILTQVAKNMWEFCLSREITLTAEHLPGLQNQTADMESRKIMETSTNNWKLNTQVFSLINKARGPIMLDILAERLNAQVTHYVSWKPDPMAVATDAFMVIWRERQAYAFPPFCLIPRCLAKVQKEGADLVIVTPAWQSQAFYPVLLEMSVADPILLSPQGDLLLSPEGNTHPLIQSRTLKLVAWKISGDQNKCKVYQNTLQYYLPQPGGKGRNQLTTAAGDTGIAGVLKNKLIPFVPLWNK